MQRSSTDLTAIPKYVAAAASPTNQALLGYKAHDATHRSGGLVGLYENGDPALALTPE